MAWNYPGRGDSLARQRIGVARPGAVESLHTGRITLVIAHWLSTIVSADRIVDIGIRAELMTAQRALRRAVPVLVLTARRTTDAGRERSVSARRGGAERVSSRATAIALAAGNVAAPRES